MPRCHTDSVKYLDCCGALRNKWLALFCFVCLFQMVICQDALLILCVILGYYQARSDGILSSNKTHACAELSCLSILATSQGHYREVHVKACIVTRLKCGQ